MLLINTIKFSVNLYICYYFSQAIRSGIRICDLIGDQSILRRKVETIYGMYKRMFPSLDLDIDADISALTEHGM